VSTGFVEVADRVFVLRYPVLDVNVTLVVGDQGALLVDTLSGAGQARELAEHVARVTTLGPAVVNTHHHFDHCYGNATLAAGGAGPFWAHHETARALRELDEHARRELAAYYKESRPELAAEIAAAQIMAPTRIVHLAATLDVGGRRVELRHLGRGHTAGDLVVLVPEVDLVVAGDLVEEGAAPGFDEGYPLEWPDTVAALIGLMSPDTVVVPGHGAVVGRAYVQTQHAQLSQLDWLIREGHADHGTAETLAARAPFDADVALVAIRRGLAELSGRYA
jgi:glyoxylase-like metal-dependent hydrolase (beta-lactamase superfamily II)